MTDPTEDEIEAAARAIDPDAFLTPEEAREKDLCGCGDCDRERKEAAELARINARAALIAAAQVRERADDAEKDLMQDALMQIYQWSRAYPLKAFPEPDFKKAAKLLKAGGITLDAISASNMRHVVEGVGKIAAHALASYLPPTKPALMPIYGATEDSAEPDQGQKSRARQIKPMLTAEHADFRIAHIREDVFGGAEPDQGEDVLGLRKGEE